MRCANGKRLKEMDPALLTPLLDPAYVYQPRFDNDADRAVLALVSQAEIDEFLTHYEMTPLRRETMRNLPQGGEEWKHRYIEEETGKVVFTRDNRMTGSTTAGLVGLGFRGFSESALEFLYHTFEGNANCEYGKQHEEIAVQLQVAYLAMTREYADASRVPVYHQPGEGLLRVDKGLIISEDRNYLSVSDDGEFRFCDGSVVPNETKCPAPHRGPYPWIPPYYFVQIHLSGYVQGFSRLAFDVYTHDHSILCEFALDQGFLRRFLLPALDDAFFNFLLPRAILVEKGVLRDGELYPAESPRPPVRILNAKVNPFSLAKRGGFKERVAATAGDVPIITYPADIFEADNGLTTTEEVAGDEEDVSATQDLAEEEAMELEAHWPGAIVVDLSHLVDSAALLTPRDTVRVFLEAH